MPDAVPLSEILYNARKAKGWSQMELAVEAQVSQSSVADYENGKAAPRERTMRRLSQALGIPEAPSPEETDKATHASEVFGNISSSSIEILEDLEERIYTKHLRIEDHLYILLFKSVQYVLMQLALERGSKELTNVTLKRIEALALIAAKDIWSELAEAGTIHEAAINTAIARFKRQAALFDAYRLIGYGEK